MTDAIKIVSKKEFLEKNEKPNQEEIWDGIANPWKTYVVKRLPIVEEFLKNKKGKIIDLGCGNGRNMIPSKKMKYYGVDFSSVQLKHAEERLKKEKINGVLFKQDGSDLSFFKNNLFDYGLFMATLHCIEGKKNREKAISEFYRVLKKGSEALISVWNSEDVRFKRIRGDIYMSWKEDGVPYMRYYYLYGKKEFLGLLKKIGFDILEFYSAREHDRFSKKNWIVRVRK
jgi:ubiquinone/menaquinone biosynthesis C-methylase UbiE